MKMHITRTFVLGLVATGFGVGLEGCSADSGKAKPEAESQAAATRRLQAVRAQFPSARADQGAGAVVRLFGPDLATGAAPADAAETFRQGYASALGLGQGDLVAVNPDRVGPQGASMTRRKRDGCRSVFQQDH